MKLSYSFSMAPPPAPAQPKLVEYSYNEFLLDLPDHWRQVPVATENSFNFGSDKEGAAIIISADFYAVPEEKAQLIAEKALDSRISVHEKQFPGRVTLLHRSIAAHSGGVGLEMSYGAEVGNDHLFLFVGYVTSRKIFNFTMVCKPDRQAATRLWNETIRRLRVTLP